MTRLRTVKPGETAKPRPKSVAVAAASGNHLELLLAMRERVAKAVSSPDCPPRDLAALTRRLQEIAKEIDVLKARASQDPADDGGEVDDRFDPAAI
ncbi:hypothetical protein [Mycobacterium marinum]|uniref:hypothetical protein n=1 Tax=Mycobacterium marinum TaxID=1781 RepID=UPI000B9682A4|nr:hypothetical protein [Mycobacterium marinum]